MLSPDAHYVVVGASRGPGRLLFQQLVEAGCRVTGIARNQPDLPTTDKSRFLTLDASDTATLLACIEPGSILIHVSRPEFLTQLLEQSPQLSRIIAIGSTRMYTRYPDDKCQRVTAMTHAVSMQNVPSTILHPTMIYGAPGLNNVERIVRYAKLLPFIPLPNNGEVLIQPVHADDVVEVIKHCLSNEETIGRTLVVPGAKAVSYRRFIELCIELSGARCRVVSFPYWLLRTAALATHLPFLPTITADEIERLTEDKHFPADAIQALGIKLLTLEAGLPLAMSLENTSQHSVP